MPPKKKEQSSEIINFYEHIPKEFLKSAYNPNFHLHKMKIPLRAVIVAPSGSGKSNFLLNLLHLFSSGKGTFGTMCLCVKNKAEPLYEWLEKQTQGEIRIVEGLHNVVPLDKMDKEVNNIVIFDDLVLEKNLDIVKSYYIRARKLNCSVVFISQSYFGIPKIIRNNCSYLILLKLTGQREVNTILSEAGLGVTKQQLLNMYAYSTKNKFHPLIIDFEEEPNSRYRHGFLEILNPDGFLEEALPEAI